MTEPLFSDLLVIDCASFIAGPAAATMLGDFGARVIKIEPPGTGDGYRMLKHLPGMPTSERNYPWTVTNRSKESLALDLKQPEGRAILGRLAERADVFITNYPLPVRERLRLRYEDLCTENERLIYASLTPYGESGPEADSTGYDATAWWARSGLMDAVRSTRETDPALSVPGMGDHMAATALYGAIVSALYRRERSGKGGMVGSSLLANGLWSNAVFVQAALDGADMDVRLDRDDRSAFTQIYACRDGRWFMLVILPQAEERGWPQLARCVGRTEWLADARFASRALRRQNNLLLTGLLRGEFIRCDWAHWEQQFAIFGITCGRVARSVDQLEDAQSHAAGMYLDFADGSGQRTLDSPMFISGAAKRAPRAAPGVGAHSLALLAELGIDGKAAAALHEAGIVGA